MFKKDFKIVFYEKDFDLYRIRPMLMAFDLNKLVTPTLIYYNPASGKLVFWHSDHEYSERSPFLSIYPGLVFYFISRKELNEKAKELPIPNA